MTVPRDHAGVHRAPTRGSVVCLVEDAGFPSWSALEHAARLASTRRCAGETGHLIVVARVNGASFLSEYAFDSGVIPLGATHSVPPVVTAMIREVAAANRLTVEIEEVFDAPQATIVQAVRASRADVVILPPLGGNAGGVARWFRRTLIASIRTRTSAIVLDEYGPSAVLVP